MIILDSKQNKVGVKIEIALLEKEGKYNNDIILDDSPHWPRFRNLSKQLINQYYPQYKNYSLMFVKFNCLGDLYSLCELFLVKNEK